MKFNWGTGILITIVVFIGIMIGIIVFAMNQQVNLVSPDYYPKGVNHEEHLQKQRNLAKLTSEVSYKKNKENLSIIFPAEFKNKEITGNIQFYYMTNFEKDIKYELDVDTSLTQNFQINQFDAGRYIIKLDWSDNEKSYYQEIDVNL